MPAKPTRLDARLFGGSDELVYLCLPDWFRNALLSLTERMLWSRVWLNEDWSDYHLTSADRDRIEYGIYQLTQDNCCEIDTEMIDEILTRLEELENMNINVNCGCGCGCGCGKNGVDDAPPPDYDATPPVTGNIPEVIDGAALANKCDMAHYLMYVLRLAAIQSANFTGGYQSWADYWGDIFTFVDDPNLTKFQYQPYITIKAALAGIHNTDVIVIPFDPIYNDLVCAIYSAGNSQQAANNVVSLLSAAYTDYFVRSMMLEIASQLPYDIAFDGSTVSSKPPGFDGRDCSSCAGGGSGSLPTPPENYMLIPLLASEVQFTNEGGTNTHSYNEVSQIFSYSATVDEWNANRVAVDIASVIARTPASQIMGGVFEVVSTNFTDPDFDILNGFPNNVIGYDYHLNGAAGLVLCRYKGDEYASNANYQEWIDQFDERSSYGNGLITGDATRWKIASHFTVKSIEYRVWFIGKV